MAGTEVLIFAEADGTVPLLEWLSDLPPKVQDKFIVRIELLQEQGHKLGRPLAAFLRDNVYELRVRHMRVNYRILYFFHEGRAVLSHGLTKEAKVPESDIRRAIRRFEQFSSDAERHTHEIE